MANILCIETSAAVCSVALAVNGETVAVRESDSGRNHAGNIGVFADEILRANNMGPEDLDAVAVSSGPGSYTGLRIGVSFAKGLCYGLQIPLIAVGSLESLVEVARENEQAGVVNMPSWDKSIMVPMIDARRMEVYTRVFDAEGDALSEVEAKIIDAESFTEFRRKAAEQGGEFVIFGDGAAKCCEVLEGARYIEVAPSASGISRLAQRAFDAQQWEDIAYFEPFYLKDFVVTKSQKNPLAKN
ncbi:MAG: tRNA (adenosine(37)-N6)-threonylcarbamoyltransferase complex dimerization subunit type 1 TsaB [Rikenellaceae bacterium]|nr:tRNA (adenosine(37)-N6)-threonylcarbamoyltransferase complex dimerization subunit type 1 TsaB [Rikenellaceae bacterium]